MLAQVASEGMVEGDAAAKSAEHEASTFLNTLRTESGEALAIIRKEDGFIDVTFLCQKAGVVPNLLLFHSAKQEV